MQQMKQIESFVSAIVDTPWLSKSGVGCEKTACVSTITEGYDSDKIVWSRQSHLLEGKARVAIGDQSIDIVFEVASAAIHDQLYRAVCDYFERRHSEDPAYDLDGSDGGLIAELMDCIKRDICWAAVEHLISKDGFFVKLLSWYKAGYWPCSWEGDYPDGRIILF